MSASTWTDIGVEMKRLGAIADRAETLRAVGPYVRDGGRWRRRTDEERLGTMFSPRFLARQLIADRGVFCAAEKEKPCRPRGQRRDAMTSIETQDMIYEINRFARDDGAADAEEARSAQEAEQDFDAAIARAAGPTEAQLAEEINGWARTS